MAVLDGIRVIDFGRYLAGPWLPWTDFLAATNCALGVVLALMEREKTGRGQLVESSLLGSALAAANGALMEQAVLRTGRVGSGSRSQAAAPSDFFRATDGWMIVQVVGNPLFARLAKMLGREDWIDDERFQSDRDRGRHGAEISEVVAQWCAARTRAQALEAFAAAGIPAGSVLGPQEALNHPHVQACGYFQSVDYPGLPQAAPLSTTPVSLSETPGRIERRPPTLGEHTDEVLAMHGYSTDDVRALRHDGVV